MVNWRDPVRVAEDSQALIKFLHCIDGLYIWEYFSTLNYEWEVVTGKRPYRWTILVYSLSRFTALLNVATNLIGFNVVTKMDCQLWIVFDLVFAYIAFASASALIMLRVIAIWNRNLVVVALSIAIWLTNVGFLIHGIVTVRSVFAPGSGCALLNTFASRNNITVTLASDVVLLFIMLAGLLRSRQVNTYGIWGLLYKQGLIWLLGATIGELPPAVFINLNLNDPWNVMFQTPGLIIMEICATRMYRALVDFTSGTISESSRGNGSTLGGMRFGHPTAATADRTTAIIPMSRMEVSVHTAYEDFTNPDEGENKPGRLSAGESRLELSNKTGAAPV